MKRFTETKKRSSTRSPSPDLIDMESAFQNVDAFSLPNTPFRPELKDDNIDDSIVEYFGISDSVKNYPLNIESSKFSEIPTSLNGNRIVEINYFIQRLIKIQYEHNRECSFGKLLPHEEKKLGLHSIIHLKCDACDKMYKCYTENPDKKSIINTGAVWGTLSVGSTFEHLEESLSSMNIPSLSRYKYSKIEEELHSVWKDGLFRSMEAAGKEEYDIAVKNNQVDEDGIPWISVYLDGGWSKRSYGHNYNANSGVGVIIGRATKKVLYVGVRNKYCVNCARAANKNEIAAPHTCFRNWTGSSVAMESDIIVEGFLDSVSMHNLRYKEFVADGDSSVFARIREKVPYGKDVRKLECINHAIKNYGKALYNIKNDKKVSVQGRKFLTIKKIKELQNAAKKAIHTSKSSGSVELLQRNIKDSPESVFSAKEFEEIKKSNLHIHLIGATEILQKKAPRLVKSETNNRAECFMNILARFTAGKRLNLIQKGSFANRSSLAGMRYNKGVRWHTSPWKKVFQSSPGDHFKNYINAYTKRREGRKKYNRKSAKQLNFPKVKNVDYGPKAEEPIPDENEIMYEKNRILENLKVDKKKQTEIENCTKEQFDSDRFISERRNRLTASNFGTVCKRRSTTPCHALVKTILYGSNACGPAIDYGKIKEIVAKRKFEEVTGLQVSKSGIFIDIEYGYLGATPDGLIGDDCILEIKCMYSLCNNNQSWEDVVKEKNFYLENVDTKISLKRSHNYYYQIQGQLHITNRKVCYFVIYKNDESDLFIQKIARDYKFWKEFMKEKLIHFYEKCLLPEIILQKIPKGLICEEEK